MSVLRYGPRRVVLSTWHPKLAATLRAAGHHVDEVDVGRQFAAAVTFARAEVVVAFAPSSSVDDVLGGAAWAKGLPLVVLHYGHGHVLCAIASWCVDSYDEVLDLLSSWDPVAKVLSPRRGP